MRVRFWIIAAALPGVACSASDTRAPRPRDPPTVVVAAAAVRDVEVLVRAPVDLKPVAQVDVGSKTLGWLADVFVDRGDQVKKGQLLAVVRPSDLPEQVAVARAQREQAAAQLGLATRTAARTQKLAQDGLASEQDQETARANAAQAAAAERAARAQARVLSIRLGETRVVAPFDGVITARRLDPGALVGTVAGAVMLTVADVTTLRAFAAVGERDAPKVKVGQRVTLTVDALGDRTFDGVVSRVAPVLDAASRSLEVEVRFPNQEGALMPGAYGRVAIVAERRAGAVTIPIEGLRTRAGRHFVLVRESEHAKRRDVVLGYDAGSWVEISSGLAAGDEVIVAGGDGLGEGAEVRVAPAASAAAAPPAAPHGSASR